MKYFGKAQETADAIVEAFRNPENLPAAIAPAFIRSAGEVPARSWSWTNQLIIALRGHSDARGYRQWQAVNRGVKKGEKAVNILVPLIKTVEDKATGEEKKVVYGFKSAPVFGFSQTEGEDLAEDLAAKEWLANLPMKAVADAWGISVATYNGKPGAAQGSYSFSGSIALGVENLSTWLHELIHAADHKNRGELKGGQQLDQETVAEFGSAVLASVLGFEYEADLGGCFNYLEGYAKREGKDVVSTCLQFFKRTCEAVQLILDAAEELEGTEPAAPAEGKEHGQSIKAA